MQKDVGSLKEDLSQLSEEIYDEINRAKSIENELSEATTQLRSEVDTLNEGGLNLKEDFIGQQVNAWLDEHPEATTTVTDDSLTESKLTLDSRKRIVREYRTLTDALANNVWEVNTFIKNSRVFDT